MQATQAKFRTLFAALLCLSVVIWSATPSFTHAPTVFETIQDHLEMVETHGHSHGFEEDLYWAMHGHSHDVADHDHSQAFLMVAQRKVPSAAMGEPRLCLVSKDGASRHFRIDRPPRV